MVVVPQPLMVLLLVLALRLLAHLLVLNRQGRRSQLGSNRRGSSTSRKAKRVLQGQQHRQEQEQKHRVWVQRPKMQQLPWLPWLGLQQRW